MSKEDTRELAVQEFGATAYSAGTREKASAGRVMFRSRQATARRQQLMMLTLVFSDVMLALFIWNAASVLQGIWGRGVLSELAAVGIIPNVAIWILLRVLLGLYPGYTLNPAEELRRQTYAAAATLAIIAIFAIALQAGNSLSRLLLVLGFLGLVLLAPLVRHFVKHGMMKLGLWGKPVVVIGAYEPGAHMVRTFLKERRLGFIPVAVFDDHRVPADRKLEGVPYGGTLADANDFAGKYGVDTAIFAMPYARHDEVAKFANLASTSFQHVIIIPNSYGVTNAAVIAVDLAGTFGVEIKHNLLNPWAQRAKRVLDLGIAVVGGVLVLPFFLVLSLLVWLESGGAVFYKDLRMGQGAKPFPCVKFRTMVPDAEAELQRLLQENVELREEYLKYHKLRDDPRITRVGRFLRKTSLDELPQVWNVLRGEMSLVGPRPYLPRESLDIGIIQSEILRVPPGITGLWQVNGRNQTSFSERVQLDAYYVRNWSVWLDLVLLARTAHTVILGRGAR